MILIPTLSFVLIVILSNLLVSIFGRVIFMNFYGIEWHIYEIQNMDSLLLFCDFYLSFNHVMYKSCLCNAGYPPFEIKIV